jgi:toxin ParE1/3/4
VKKRRVSFAPAASADFNWIFDTLSRKAGPLIALEYIRRLEHYCRSLELASERGSRRIDQHPGLHIIGFERRATIAFTVDGESVTVLRVFYGGANWQDEL